VLRPLQVPNLESSSATMMRLVHLPEREIAGGLLLNSVLPFSNDDRNQLAGRFMDGLSGLL